MHNIDTYFLVLECSTILFMLRNQAQISLPEYISGIVYSLHCNTCCSEGMFGIKQLVSLHGKEASGYVCML